MPPSIALTHHWLLAGMQFYVRPYKEPESNVLKALVEAQIFLTFLISFILRVLPRIVSYEPFGAQFYGFLLVGSLSGIFLAAIILTAHQIRRRRRFRVSLMDEVQQAFTASIREDRPSELFSRGVSGIFSRPVGTRKKASPGPSLGAIELQSVTSPSAPPTARPLLGGEARPGGQQ